MLSYIIPSITRGKVIKEKYKMEIRTQSETSKQEIAMKCHLSREIIYKHRLQYFNSYIQQ